jgi:hypothetical protein
MDKGFILSQDSATAPDQKGDLAFFTDDPAAIINNCWFRGGWWDPLTMAWQSAQTAQTTPVPPQPNSPGASFYVPFTLQPGQQKTIRLLIAWYVPDSRLQVGAKVTDPKDSTVRDASVDLPSPYYKPWYSSMFQNIGQVTKYWGDRYAELRRNTVKFRDAFYRSTLPPEVTEAVAANLSILKSPTVCDSMTAGSGAGRAVMTNGAVAKDRVRMSITMLRPSAISSRHSSVLCAKQNSSKTRIPPAISNSAPHCPSGPWHILSTPHPTASWEES